MSLNIHEHAAVNSSMHIAHSSKKTLSVEQIAQRTGLKRRQIANLARAGKIPGAVRRDGFHFEYRVCPELIEWIEWKTAKVAEQRHPKSPRAPREGGGVLNIQGIRVEFDIWLRRVGGVQGILKKLTQEERGSILREIKPIAWLYFELTQRLGPKPR